MTIVAFAGPSVRAGDRAPFSGIEWRPPAQAGDLLRLSVDEGSAVCLIDGYFDHRPAVRHKEILLLLSEGVRIYGASSIGALRAAEMRIFGMIGVGAIFSAYARGTIQGDDEVALIHAGADRDWRPLSIPLVDVRATLRRARRQRVLGRDEARELLRAASSIHYIDREWRSICESVGGSRAFKAWVGEGALSQKREDAVACLRRARGDTGLVCPRPKLVRTCFLDALARDCGVDREIARSEPAAMRA